MMADIRHLTIADKMALMNDILVLEKEAERRRQYKFYRYYPDTGPLRRELYRTVVQFFDAGKRYPERLLMGGNRTGKTEGAAYEVSCHLTGLYPPWWTGKRFNHPTEWWAASQTATVTRDVMQLALYGPKHEAPKTGMIPGHLIVFDTPKNSIPNGIETIWVKHVSGGTSTVQFKSYDQGRASFQGTARNIWFDEECPEDVYTEALLRTLILKEGDSGIVIVTFTPVEGLTPFVQQWLEHSVMFDYSGEPKPAEAQVFEGQDEETVDTEKVPQMQGESPVVPLN